MNRTGSALFAMSVSILMSQASLASTILTVDDGVRKKTATTENCGGLEPTDFIVFGAGEDETFLDVCYSGDPQDVLNILNAIASSNRYWEVTEFRITHQVVHAEFEQARTEEQVHVMARPCR